MLNGTKIKDCISTESLLSKFGILSTNQLNAQVKLLETWKALFMEDYPLQVPLQSVPTQGMSTRAAIKGKPIEIGRSNLTKSTSVSDAVRIWNLAPESISGAKSLYQAKSVIKSFVRCIPI